MRRERLGSGPFDDKAGVGDHLQVGRTRRALSGEVIPEENRICNMQPERLEAPEVHFTPASDTHLDVGEDKAEHRKHAQALRRRELDVPRKWRSLERHIGN